MSTNDIRSRGRPSNYTFDRANTPAEMGPYVGIVVNNFDARRSGTLQVYIEQFGEIGADGKPNLANDKLWRTVRYCPPFFGYTNNSGPTAGTGTYPGNANSYGMWFTAPDIGTEVLCFFVGGDPLKGYYLGCIPGNQINHMVPAIGASSKYVLNNQAQQSYFANTPFAPVSEINYNDPAVAGNPRFFEKPKPLQSVVAGILLQQGLSKDPVRGPIRSSAQRESPSTVYGISTPGRPIYGGALAGLDPQTVKAKLQSGTVRPQDAAIIGRQGGHTFVMDDGDIQGTDSLVRIRTAKGHQITMSDDGNCFYIIHANGQTWLEFGKEGSVDLFSTNSINLRTQGQLNMHADRGINMYSGTTIRVKSKTSMAVEAGTTMSLIGTNRFTAYSKVSLNLKSDGKLAMASKAGSWNGGSSLTLNAGVIHLNGGSTIPVTTPASQQGYLLSDTVFVANQGWVSRPRVLETIVTRAPTHEPYAYHGQGVDLTRDLDSATTTAAAPAPVGSLLAKAESLYGKVSGYVITNGMNASDYLKTLPANAPIPPTAQAADSLDTALAAAEALARGTVTGSIGP
jgi:hypothetical protein